MIGHYNKYIIRKVSGKKIDKDAEYFVLRIDKDIHAVNALYTYALSVNFENPKLCKDLLKKFRYYKEKLKNKD